MNLICYHTACAALLCAATLSPAAAASDERPSRFVSAGVDGSNDSDGFSEFKPWTQYEGANGWGLRAGWQHYAIDGWSTEGRSLYLTHQQHTPSWTSQGRLGLNRSAGHSHWVGVWDGMYQLSRQTSAGVSLERDVVNSRRGLTEGLTATTAMAVLDQQLSPRWSLGLAAGSTWFSDDNRRDTLRSRWTFTLSEDQGLYAYATTRHYRNSEPYRRAYFSPERFREAALGLMWKKALNDQVVLSTHADLGRQYIEGEGQRLWHVGLYLSAPHRAAIQWKLGFATSRDHASSISGSSVSYRYTNAVANVRIPF